MRMQLALIVIAVLAATGHAQTPPVAGPCSQPAFHALDFWVGQWGTTNARGQKGGDSRIERVADGCAILERFGETRGALLGAGLHTYDVATKTWTQYWTDNRGVTLAMRGTVLGTVMTYDWTAPVAGTPQKQRYTLAPQPDGTVLQTGYATTDSGKTWSPAWRLTYRKATPDVR